MLEELDKRLLTDETEPTRTRVEGAILNLFTRWGVQHLTHGHQLR